jgi:hypothetical protein
VLSSDINGSSRGKKMWVILKEAVIWKHTDLMNTLTSVKPVFVPTGPYSQAGLFYSHYSQDYVMLYVEKCMNFGPTYFRTS